MRNSAFDTSIALSPAVRLQVQTELAQLLRAKAADDCVGVWTVLATRISSGAAHLLGELDDSERASLLEEGHARARATEVLARCDLELDALLWLGSDDPARWIRIERIATALNSALMTATSASEFGGLTRRAEDVLAPRPVGAVHGGTMGSVSLDGHSM